MAAAGRRRRCGAGGHAETSGAIERRPCGEGRHCGSRGVKDGPVKLEKAAARRPAGPSSGGREEKDDVVAAEGGRRLRAGPKLEKDGDIRQPAVRRTPPLLASARSPRAAGIEDGSSR